MSLNKVLLIGNVGKSKIVDVINEYLENKKTIYKIEDVMNTKF